MNTYTATNYANGRPYSPLHARLAGHADFCLPNYSAFPPIITLNWSTFWRHISHQLHARRYAESTCAQYRTILRSFYRHARRRPAETTTALIHDYIVKLTAKNYSWSWIGMNISVLRSVFDKLAGQTLTRHFSTPKRALALPEILSRNEINALLAAADTTRDQLLLGLLYGCGLKVSELRHLTWADIDTGYLHVRPTGGEPRTLEIPGELVPVLDYGKSRCQPADYLFQGRYGGAPLSIRMIELIIRRASHAASILKPVTAMTLRHTYAVHCLENGENIRALQEALGHEHIKTTMRYNRCILPTGLESPLDQIKRSQREGNSEPPIMCQSSVVGSFQPAAPPTATLFTHPLKLEALELPFVHSATDLASRFYRLLKTIINGRFLGRRRAGPPPS